MFIVITGTKGNEHIEQRRVLDAESWDATVQQIAEGQWTDISQVLRGNADVLPLMAREVQDIWADRGDGLKDWERDFIEQNVSIQAANKFAQAAE